jgi:hypothetical protein
MMLASGPGVGMVAVPRNFMGNASPLTSSCKFCILSNYQKIIIVLGSFVLSLSFLFRISLIPILLLFYYLILLEVWSNSAF